MKKTLIAFAALTAIAGVAQAQSTVTIYGVLDANLSSTKANVADGVKAGAAQTGSVQNRTQTLVNSGGLNGSRWGIRVNEDLGGGLAAIGNLESGIDIDTGASGQGGLLFGRRANVGLTGGFGTATIGRNSSSYDDVSADHAMMGQSPFDPSNTNNGISAKSMKFTAGADSTPTAAAITASGLGTVAGNAAVLSRSTTWVGYNTRFDNSIKYISPTFGGFSGSVMYAFGEDKTATVSATKTISANVKYANGPLVVSGGYQSEASAATATTKPALVNTLISASYDLGVAKIGAGFNRAKYKDVMYTPIGGTAHELAAQKEFNLSVSVPLGATTLSAGYAQSKGDDLGKSSGYGVQALYALSKRTTLYTGVVSTKTYDTLAAQTSLLATDSSIGRNTKYAAGVRHTF